MPSEFSSAAKFFRDKFEESKRASSSFNVRQFAQELGIGASSLKMILSGKRSPTPHQALAAAKALKLSPWETSHLDNLARLDGAENDWERAYYLKILKKLKKERKVSRTDVADKGLLTDPFSLPLLVYFMELGEKAPLKTTMPEMQKLAAELKCPPARLQQLLAHFKTLGLLTQEEKGGFHVVFNRMNHKHLQKQYLKNLLAVASQRIDTEYEGTTSHFVSYTFTATDKALWGLRMDIKALMEKYMAEVVDTKEAVQIAQANIQIYPVMKLS